VQIIKIKHFTISLILILSLLLSAGCTLMPEEWSEPTVPEVEDTTPVTPTVSDATTPSDTAIDPGWTTPPCQYNEPLPDFVAVVAKVKPSVVAIQTDTGAGSGWIIREDGIIVTNNHVVAGAQNIAIILDDERTFDAEEVRTDPLTDLAVIKIDAQDLPAAHIGDCSTLQVGEQVAAIGNALGLGIRMTGGWISRLNVSIPVGGQRVDDLIETDAAINPGNSGGPLVNMAGEVIGITSIKIAEVGVEGLGYAISMTSAQDIIDELIVRGYVIRPYLGVGLADITPIVAFWNDLSVESGALVINVAPGSPADAAGLEKGDIIVSIDGIEILTSQDLIKEIHARDIGQDVSLVYWRGENKYTTTATLTVNPPPPWL